MKSHREHRAMEKGSRRVRSPFFCVRGVRRASCETGGTQHGADGAQRGAGIARNPSAAALNVPLALLVCMLGAWLMFYAPSPVFAQDVLSEDLQAVPITVNGEQLVPAEGSALHPNVDFGLNGFSRSAKGTERHMDGVPPGYRFPLDEDANLVAIRTPAIALLYVDAEAARQAGFDTADFEHIDALTSMVEVLDEEFSMGGALLSDPDTSWIITTEPEVVREPYLYRFQAEGADGSRFVTVTLAGDPDDEISGPVALENTGSLGDGALWCDSAELVPAGLVSTVPAPTPVERLVSFLSAIDYRPLWISLKTAGLALAISFVLGLLAAWRVVGTSSRMKGLLDSVFTIPMVLPPTVCGFLLLMLFGQSTAVGRWLIDHGVSLVFTWEAAVFAAVVVSFPLVYRTALGAFEALDAAMLDAARTLGWSEWRIFRRIMFPLAWPSIAAGTVLAFARAMGEFGCTLFFAGNYAGITQTIPIAIYFEWMGGNTSVALFWVVVVIAFSFLVVWGINAYTARQQVYRGRSVGAHLTRSGNSEGADCRVDGLELTGGDAVRIDRDALRALLSGDAGEGE